MSFAHAAQIIQEFAKRLAAVGDGKLFLGAEFGKGFAQRREKEEGVVAEAAGAPGPIDDEAVGAALGDGEDASALGQRDDADIVRGATCGP